MNGNSLITLTGGMALLSLLVTLAAIAPTTGFDVGCHIVGTEINGDYSTEYLQLGNC